MLGYLQLIIENINFLQFRPGFLLHLVQLLPELLPCQFLGFQGSFDGEKGIPWLEHMLKSEFLQKATFSHVHLASHQLQGTLQGGKVLPSSGTPQTVLTVQTVLLDLLELVIEQLLLWDQPAQHLLGLLEPGRETRTETGTKLSEGQLQPGDLSFSLLSFIPH